jgi:hypothetical protein
MVTMPMDDSLCRFNPIYGQGMMSAAKQAKLLHDEGYEQGRQFEAPCSAPWSHRCEAPRPNINSFCSEHAATHLLAE